MVAIDGEFLMQFICSRFLRAGFLLWTINLGQHSFFHVSIKAAFSSLTMNLGNDLFMYAFSRIPSLL